MSGSRAPLAPEKGVFPLDHFGECKKAMRAYLACLRKHGDDAATCREVSKKYLECRMDRELMAKQPLEELGFWGRATTRTGDATRPTARRDERPAGIRGERNHDIRERARRTRAGIRRRRQVRQGVHQESNRYRR